MKDKKVFMNPMALGWFVIIALVSVAIGIAVGFSSGIKAGIITMLITFLLFGGIEGLCLFLSDQSLMNPKRKDQA